MLPRQHRHEVRRHLRRVGERLVVHRRQLGDDVHDVARRHGQLRMVRPEVLRDRGRKGRLVIGRVGESNPEGADGRAALGLHQSGDQRRIDAAGEKHAKGHVGHQSNAHRVAGQPLDLVRRLLDRSVEAMLCPADCRVAHRPVDRRLRLPRRPVDPPDVNDGGDLETRGAEPLF